jgi:hypothetical protein
MGRHVTWQSVDPPGLELADKAGRSAMVPPPRPEVRRPLHESFSRQANPLTRPKKGGSGLFFFNFQPHSSDVAL